MAKPRKLGTPGRMQKAKVPGWTVYGGKKKRPAGAATPARAREVRIGGGVVPEDIIPGGGPGVKGSGA